MYKVVVGMNDLEEKHKDFEGAFGAMVKKVKEEYPDGATNLVLATCWIEDESVKGINRALCGVITFIEACERAAKEGIPNPFKA